MHTKCVDQTTSNQFQERYPFPIRLRAANHPLFPGFPVSGFYSSRTQVIPGGDSCRGILVSLMLCQDFVQIPGVF
jgi:hypothetical protein